MKPARKPFNYGKHAGLDMGLRELRDLELTRSLRVGGWWREPAQPEPLRHLTPAEVTALNLPVHRRREPLVRLWAAWLDAHGGAG